VFQEYNLCVSEDLGAHTDWVLNKACEETKDQASRFSFGTSRISNP